MENNDKSYTEGIKLGGRLFRWLDNYWYHYKWLTIGIAFALIVFSVCTLQMCQREKEDTIIVYAGPGFMQDKADDIKSVFSSVLPKDYDGDGVKRAELSVYIVYSREQIEEIEAQTNADGTHVDVNNWQISQNRDNYYDYLMTGESAICMLDSSLYEELLENDRLTELFVNEAGEDVFGIALKDTEIYREFDVLKEIPEDTVLCLLRQSVVGKIADDELYQNERDIFFSIINWSAE